MFLLKKVSAVFLAVVLTMALAVVSVSAATNNVSIRTLSSVPPGTLLYEQVIYGPPSVVTNGAMDGTDLIRPLRKLSDQILQND
jgi:hypothetical protein